MGVRFEPWLAGLLLLSACADAERRYELVDSVDVAFAIEPRDVGYVLEDPDDMPVPCNHWRPGWAMVSGRALELCSACIDEDGSWSTAPILHCRVTVCTTNEDCPQFGTWSYVCASGVCQDVDLVDEMTVSGILAQELCVADVPRESDDASMGPNLDLEARFAALDCDDEMRECSLPLPDGCLQLGE